MALSVIVQRAIRTFALGGLIAATGCLDVGATEGDYVSREEKRFSVQGTPDITLGTFDGSIDVRSWDRREVLVVIERRALDEESASAIRVDVRQEGDRITVEARTDARQRGGFSFDNRSASLIVTLPKMSRVQAKSGDGRIDVRDVSGELTVLTGDGSIRLDAVDGAVEARSGDGSIHVDGLLTRLRVSSGDGRVTVRAASGSTASEDWNITTGDGSVVLELPAGFGGELDAHTGDGRITVHDMELLREEEVRSRETVRGRLGNGGSRVRVQTGDGSITLRLHDSRSQNLRISGFEDFRIC